MNNQTRGRKHESLGKIGRTAAPGIRNVVLTNSIKHAYAFCEGEVKPDPRSFCCFVVYFIWQQSGSLATPMKTREYLVTANDFHKMLQPITTKVRIQIHFRGHEYEHI